MSKLCLPFLGLAMFLFASPGNVTADDKHNAAYEACAKACNDCQRACDQCTTHCATLVAEGKKDHLTTLKECQDCATCCSAAAQIVARGGPCCVMMCECCAKTCATVRRPARSSPTTST